MNKFPDSDIVSGRLFVRFIVRQFSLNKINNETGDLGLQHVKVVGDNNEQRSYA
jgi:hypothetical protein